MPPVLISLETASTGYGVFEENQVLTHTQLNDLAAYLDDHQRLTRVALIGVGVVCGLRLGLRDGQPVVTRGVGITTDGDIIRLDADAVFDRVKAYGETAPTYAPLMDGETMRPAFELVRQGVDDAVAESIDAFQTRTGRTIGRMVGVLYMESYVKDNDLCSGTDCDNLGRDALNTTRLLLVDEDAAGALDAGLASLNASAAALAPLVAARPLLSGGMNSPAAMATAFRSACTSTHNGLVGALGRTFPSVSGLTDDLFSADPTPRWVARLVELNGAFANTQVGLQYYYGFLKDVVETYNALAEALTADGAVCLPSVTAFPKHLMLGGLATTGGTVAHRTRFYPSPALSMSTDRRGRVRFLLSRLDALIATFAVPSGANLAIKVTPSRTEDRPLDERAIPFYYRVDPATPLHQSWSYALHRRGLDRYNYSYNAPAYEAQGAAAQPLAAQIGAFNFFRVEGHVGQPVTAAVQAIQKTITDANLPFTVRAVMLGTDRGRVVRPPIRYTDLHRFHYMLRQDVAQQLDDMVVFSDNFKTRVQEAVTKGVVLDVSDDTDGVSVTQIATQKNLTVNSSATSARQKLARTFTEYQQEPLSWQGDIREAVTAGTEFKLNLGAVSKAEVVTPVDSLIANNHMVWVNWLDQIIKDKDDKEDEKLLFPQFFQQNPGAEHYAGVPRGGTLILVHDVNGTVVADLTLPYYWAEVAEAQPEEKPLPKVPIKPGILVEKPIRMIAPLDRFVTQKLTSFKAVELEPAWKRDIAVQGNYVAAIKDSVEVLNKAISVPKATLPGGVVGGRDQAVLTDPLLDLRVRDTNTKAALVDSIRDRLLDPEVNPQKRTDLEGQLKEAEGDLARSISSTTNYVSSNDVDIKQGSDGFAAMSTVTAGLSKLADRGALTKVHRELAKTSTTASTDLKGVIGSVIKTRFGNT